jgi:hypothetical protein
MLVYTWTYTNLAGRPLDRRRDPCGIDRAPSNLRTTQAVVRFLRTTGWSRNTMMSPMTPASCIHDRKQLRIVELMGSSPE